MTYGELATQARSQLESHYPPGEARAMIRIIFERVKGYSPTDMAVKSDEQVSDFIADKVGSVVHRLLADEPIQYIFGVADFYGMEFKVSPDVLIPRPETAELVDIIVDENSSRKDLTVMDLCTGSGCIACALARNLPFSKVSAVDNSDGALAVAQANNRALSTGVSISKADVLHLAPAEGKFDIIVSNPPYIAESEKAAMEANVLDHEPHTALFVPDSDPLLFYKAIAEFAKASIKPDGALYLEINPLYVSELRTMLASVGFTDVTISRDSSGRERFATARP